MSRHSKDLVILAAGIGSRFKGGIKQLHSVGPSGECIMDYSIYDAVEAGFTRIVFIIRRDIEALFETLIGNRVRPFCRKHGVEVACVFQEKANLPGDFSCPADRAKPWGTGHALLCCKGSLQHKFAVVNADDYYGKDAFRQMAGFLDALTPDTANTYALAGFRLDNTLSDCGGVTRGLCRTGETGLLTDIREVKNIHKFPDGPGVVTESGVTHFPWDTPASMNMWAMTDDILERMEAQFMAFLAEGGLEDPKSEFLIPVEVGAMLSHGVTVQVLPVSGQWLGMTFAEDIPDVRAAFSRMHQEGQYPTPLL